MKIFSNFDTEFKDRLYNEYVKKYGKDKVILITRHKIFLILHVIFPLFLLILLISFLLVVGFVIDLDGLNNLKWIVIFVFVFFSILIFLPKIFKRFIDYYMDFAIVTPKEVISYNQTGIFSRDSRSLDVDKIKTITVDKKGLLKSIFNFGDVVFLSEGDDSGRGDIRLKYIHDPDKLREKIIRIVEFGEGS